MKFTELLHALGGKPIDGCGEGVYQTADWTLSQIKSKSPKQLEVKVVSIDVMLEMPVKEGTAIFFGENSKDGIIRNGRLLLLRHPPNPDRSDKIKYPETTPIR